MRPGRFLFIGHSARALVAAARRAGMPSVSVDFFADSDTRTMADLAVAYPGDIACGFSRRRLLPLLEEVERTAGPIAAIIPGSGFEDRPRLLSALAARWPLAGNPETVVRRAKNRRTLFAAATAAGLAMPAPLAEIPDNGGRYLLRRPGGSGGLHLEDAAPGPVPRGFSGEAFMPGRPLALAVLCDGRNGRLVAITRQWTDPSPDAPYRYGGAVGPVPLVKPLARQLAAAASRLAGLLGLRGLVSFDGLLDEDRFTLLEVNPRPGASLDVLTGLPDLMARHVAACLGTMGPVPPPADGRVRAAAVVYGERPGVVLSRGEWPEFVADRPMPGALVETGAPVATLFGNGADEAEALANLALRRAEFAGWIGERSDVG